MLSILRRLCVLMFLLAPAATVAQTVVPNFPDLTIKTRLTLAETRTMMYISYFKGARQRIEVRQDGPPHIASVTITQCDQNASYFLDEQRKTYLMRSVDGEFSKRIKGESTPANKTADVTVTTDSVDTGERRQIGSYSARHVKTTLTIDPSEETGIQASTTETDGWYLDLPGWNCREDVRQGIGMLVARVGDRQPHYIFRQLGSARRGLVVEETTSTTQKGFTTKFKTEFVEVSEAPLDPDLFEIPADYTRISQPAEP